MLPEVAVNSAAPPSLFCPLVPSNGQNGNGGPAADAVPKSAAAIHSNGTVDGCADTVSNGNGHAGNEHTNSHSRHSRNGYSNGTTTRHSRNSSANGHSRHTSSNGSASQRSVPGVYLDLESELDFARVSCRTDNVDVHEFCSGGDLGSCHLLQYATAGEDCPHVLVDRAWTKPVARELVCCV